MTPSSPRQDNAVIPTAFLIGVTALLIYFAVPQRYSDTLPATPTPTMTPLAVAAIEPTPEDHLSLMALGLEEVSSSSVQTGSRLFSTTCTACHGSDARGILGLGKTLVTSPFVNRLNDDELVAFLHVGRPTTDPDNTTGVVMPAKGGNPSLSDDDLNAIVDYIRSLNGATVVNDVAVAPTTIPTLRPFQAIDTSGLGTTGGVYTEPTSSAPATSPTLAATPVTSYGYDTQAAATEESIPLPAMTPTTVYTYQTAPDATNVPPVYSYEHQGTQP